MKELSDDKLISLIINGDIDLYQELIERYKERIFKIVSSHIPFDNIEEVASDIFFKAYKSLPKFKYNSPFIHYLSVIAVNTCRDFWRETYSNKEQNMSSFTEDVEKIIENRPTGKTPEENMLEKERKKILYLAINQLKDNERLIINMMYIEERSVSEIAKLINMTETNVKVISFRARKKLAEIMNDLMEA